MATDPLLKPAPADTVLDYAAQPPVDPLIGGPKALSFGDGTGAAPVSALPALKELQDFSAAAPAGPGAASSPAPTGNLPTGAAADPLAAPPAPAFAPTFKSPRATSTLSEFGYGTPDRFMGLFDSESGDLTKEGKMITDAIVGQEAAAAMAEYRSKGRKPPSRTELEAAIQADLMLDLVRNKQGAASALAAATAASAAAAGPAPDDGAGWWGVISSSAAGAGLAATADTLDLMNWGLTKAFGEDSGDATQNETLSAMSEYLRVQSNSMYDYAATNANVEQGDKEVEGIWAGDDNAGVKVLKTAGVTLTNGTWLSSQIASSLGYVAASVVGGGAAGAVFKGGARALGGAVVKEAAKRSAFGEMIKLGATIAVPIAGATVRQSEDAMNATPDEVLMATPGWDQTKGLLRGRYGREPTTAEVRGYMTRKSADLSALIGGGTAMLATIMSPLTERAILGLGRSAASKVTGATVDPLVTRTGGRVGGLIKGGAAEAAAETFQEGSQAAAPLIGQSVAQGDGFGDALGSAASNPDVQMAATLGGILGGIMGGGIGALGGKAAPKAEAAPATAAEKVRSSIRQPGAEEAAQAAAAYDMKQAGARGTPNTMKIGPAEDHGAYGAAAPDGFTVVYSSAKDGAVAVNADGLVMSAKAGAKIASTDWVPDSSARARDLAQASLHVSGHVDAANKVSASPDVDARLHDAWAQAAAMHSTEDYQLASAWEARVAPRSPVLTAPDALLPGVLALPAPSTEELYAAQGQRIAARDALAFESATQEQRAAYLQVRGQLAAANRQPVAAAMQPPISQLPLPLGLPAPARSRAQQRLNELMNSAAAGTEFRPPSPVRMLPSPRMIAEQALGRGTADPLAAAGQPLPGLTFDAAAQSVVSALETLTEKLEAEETTRLEASLSQDMHDYVASVEAQGNITDELFDAGTLRNRFREAGHGNKNMSDAALAWFDRVAANPTAADLRASLGLAFTDAKRSSTERQVAAFLAAKIDASDKARLVEIRAQRNLGAGAPPVMQRPARSALPSDLAAEVEARIISGVPELVRPHVSSVMRSTVQAFREVLDPKIEFDNRVAVDARRFQLERITLPALSALIQSGVTVDSAVNALVDLRRAFPITRAEAEAMLTRAAESPMTVQEAASFQREAAAEQDATIRGITGLEVYAEPVARSVVDAKVEPIRQRFQTSTGFGHRTSTQVLVYETYADAIAAHTSDTATLPLQLPTGIAAAFVETGRGDALLIIRDRIKDEAHLDRVIAHELVGHYGVRSVLGEAGIRLMSVDIMRGAAARDKGVQNLVNAAKREMQARFGAEWALANSTQTQEDYVKARMRASESSGVLAEEVLALAAEDASLRKDPAKVSAARRIVEWFRNWFAGRTGLVIRNLDDISRVLFEAERRAAGQRLDWRFESALRKSVDTEAVASNKLQRAWDYIFNEEEALFDFVKVARTVGDRTDPSVADRNLTGMSEELRHRVESAANITASLYGGVRQHVFALEKAIDKVEAMRPDGMTASEFRAQAKEWLVLKGLESRVRRVTIMAYESENTDPLTVRWLAARDQAIKDIEALSAQDSHDITDDTPKAHAERNAKAREIVARFDAIELPLDLQVKLADNKIGSNIVGLSVGEVRTRLMALQLSGVGTLMREAPFFGPEGHITRATDEILRLRRMGDYGDAGYARTMMLGLEDYLPLRDVNRRPDGGIEGLKTASPGARIPHELEGQTSLPDASAVEQLQSLAMNVAAGVTTRRINNLIANISTTTSGDVREGFERFASVSERYDYEAAKKKFGSMSFNERLQQQVAWDSDGSARFITVKDARLLNAMNKRFDPTLWDNWAARGAQRATRAYASVLTTFNIPFVLTRQIPRDMYQAIMQSGFEHKLGSTETAALVKESMQNLWPLMRHFASDPESQAKALEAAREDVNHPLHGLVQRSLRGGAPLFTAQLYDTLDTSAVSGLPGADLLQGVRRRADTISRVMSSPANAAENAVRQALFDAVVRVERAKRNNPLTLDEIYTKAADISLNTMNFGQRSAVGRFLGTMFPFAQTALTGVDQIFRRRIWKDGQAPVEMVDLGGGQWRRQVKWDGLYDQLNKPLLATIGVMAVGSTLAAIAAAKEMADDDDRVEEILKPASIMRSLFMPFNVGDTPEAPLQLPMQNGFYQIVHGAASAVTMVAAGYPADKVGAALFDHVTANTAPLEGDFGADMSANDIMKQFIPSVFQPLFQVAANINSFGGAVYTEGESGQARGVSTFTPSPSFPQVYVSMAQEIYDVTGYDASPEIMRHTLRGYLSLLATPLEVAGRYLQGSDLGTSYGVTDTALDLSGWRSRDPLFAASGTFFAIDNELVAPLRLAKDRALKADRIIDPKNGTYNDKQQGPNMKAFVASIGGVANAKDILGAYSSRSNRISELKIKLQSARAAGDRVLERQLIEEYDTIHRQLTAKVTAALDAAGIQSPDDISHILNP